MASKRKLEKMIDEYNYESEFVVVLSKTEDQIIAWTGEDFSEFSIDVLLDDIEDILYECGYEIDTEANDGGDSNFIISLVKDNLDGKIHPCVRINFKEKQN